MKTILLSSIIGILVGVSASYVWLNSDGASTHSMATTSNEKKAKEPLYWVAPMDPNFRRDKPGKSPMGMDLVPVFEEENSGDKNSIKISAAVEHNLGVKTASVIYDQLSEQIHTTGVFTYNPDNLRHLHPRIDGWVEKLFTKAAGDPVTKDQPLYSLYSPTLVNAQEELLLALDRKNKRLIHAAEQRLLALAVSEKVIKDLKRTRKVKQVVTFYAPSSGFIAELNIQEGSHVSPGKTLMILATLENLWLEAEVFPQQAQALAPDAPVYLSVDALPGETWETKVDYIEPDVDPQSRTVKVRASLPNRAFNLKPNMFANICIEAKTNDKHILTPKESVIYTGTKARVILALGDGRYQAKNVTVGRSNESYTEITAGLSRGDKVVTSGQFLIDSEADKQAAFASFE